MSRWRAPQGLLATLVASAAEGCAARRRVHPGLPNDILRTRPVPRGFLRALLDSTPRTFPLICEVKRASPSAGVLRTDAEATVQAQCYARGGGRCISVLTEPTRFRGSLADLEAVRAAVEVPLLRKDFIVDTYMVYEAAAFGADAILLIATALPPSRLVELAACAREVGLDVLLELVHEHELEVLAQVDTPLVGVNARDLETLEVDPGRFARLAPQLARPDRLLVAESGIRTPADVQRLAREGAGAALVGEALMRADHPVEAVRALADAVS